MKIKKKLVPVVYHIHIGSARRNGPCTFLKNVIRKFPIFCKTQKKTVSFCIYFRAAKQNKLLIIATVQVNFNKEKQKQICIKIVPNIAPIFRLPTSNFCTNC